MTTNDTKPNKTTHYTIEKDSLSKAFLQLQYNEETKWLYDEYLNDPIFFEFVNIINDTIYKYVPYITDPVGYNVLFAIFEKTAKMFKMANESKIWYDHALNKYIIAVEFLAKVGNRDVKDLDQEIDELARTNPPLKVINNDLEGHSINSVDSGGD